MEFVKPLCHGMALLALATLAQAQAPVVGGIVNSGSYYAGAGVAPGSIVSIFGTNLASQTTTAGSLPLPTSLGDVSSVTFNGVPAALFYVSPGQINAQAPPWFLLNPFPGLTLLGGDLIVVVTNGAGSSVLRSVPIVAAQPGIFTVSANGVGQAIATDNADGAIASATHPIQIGSYLIVWCTGLGAVDAAGNTLATPTVTIGGVPATLIYSALSPQYVGEYLVAVQVAPGTPTGNAVPLQIQVAGETTLGNVT